MKRFDETFSALRAKNEKALVAFVTAGDPWPQRTHEIMAAVARGGADVIEVGIPFSDPLADGPTIQASSHRALEAGMTPPMVLDAVRKFRAGNDTTPVVLMGAWNPILQYGVQRFVRDAADAGVDGTIVTDLTPEEAGEWKRVCDAGGLATVFLLAPTSTVARMALVGKMASGFLYCVSRTGVTGAREEIPDDLPPLIDAIRQRAEGTPVCVGFGISRPEHVRAVAAFADGAVVGSAFVDLLHRERDNPDLPDTAAQFIATLKAGTRA